MFRQRGAKSNCVLSARLVSRDLDSRLRFTAAARGSDALRREPSPRGRIVGLGRNRNRRHLDRLHGRCRPFRPSCSTSGARIACEMCGLNQHTQANEGKRCWTVSFDGCRVDVDGHSCSQHGRIEGQRSASTTFAPRATRASFVKRTGRRALPTQEGLWRWPVHSCNR
jgi:hypothetical protein